MQCAIDGNIPPNEYALSMVHNLFRCLNRVMVLVTPNVVWTSVVSPILIGYRVIWDGKGYEVSTSAVS